MTIKSCPFPALHTPPTGDTAGIEILARVKQAFALDEARSRVVVSEHNVDEWPNASLSPVPGKPGAFAYDSVRPGLFKQIKARFLGVGKEIALERPAADARAMGQLLHREIGGKEIIGRYAFVAMAAQLCLPFSISPRLPFRHSR